MIIKDKEVIIMNINNRTRLFIYLIVLLGFTFLIFKEYTYVRSYRDCGNLYASSSSTSITWFLLVFSSAVMIIPIFRKQKIGYLGLMLFVGVLLLPQVHPKIMEETAKQFYVTREVELKLLVKKYSNHPDRKIIKPSIKELDFEKLHIIDGNYFFLVWDEDYPYPYGICYSEFDNLPSRIFDRPMNYTELEEDWYAFDYISN